MEWPMKKIRTGDVLYRKSDTLGPFYIPVNRLVAIFTKSAYSHASIAVKENGFTNVVEICGSGVKKVPLEKWECCCVGQVYSVYRFKDGANKEAFAKEVARLIKEFAPDNAYCTEAVVKMYEKAGHKDVFVPMRIRDVVPFWVLCIIRPINAVIRMFTGKGLNFYEPLYFVGNEKQGMMSSIKMFKVKDVHLN
jgi:hypothetical protein